MAEQMDARSVFQSLVRYQIHLPDSIWLYSILEVSVAPQSWSATASVTTLRMTCDLLAIFAALTWALLWLLARGGTTIDGLATSYLRKANAAVVLAVWMFLELVSILLHWWNGGDVQLCVLTLKHPTPANDVQTPQDHLPRLLYFQVP